MTKLRSLLAAAALLAGCNAATISPEEVRRALPQADAVQIGPADAHQSGALTKPGPGAEKAGRAALVLEAPSYRAPYALTSYWTAVTVNVGVWWTLTLVDVITSYPPTSCDAEQCTWGPWTGEDGLNTWQLEVRKEGDGFPYVLSATPLQGGAARAILSGRAYPGVDRRRGHGSFTIDFEAEASLAHAPGWTQHDFGRIDVTYDGRTTVQVTATFLGARNQDPADRHRLNAAYAFDGGQAGGDFQVGLQRLDTGDTLKLHTRWNASGAGRGDASFVAGSTQASASECWDGAPSYAMVYDGAVYPTTGDEALCAFALAAPTIELPAR